MYKLYKNIFQVLAPVERKTVRVFVLANTVVSLLDIACIVYLLLVLKFYTGGKDVFPGNVWLRNIFAEQHAVMPAIWLLLLFSIKNMMGHMVYQRQVKFITRTANRLSRDNLAAYLEGDYQNFANKDSAVFVSKIIHQPTEFAQYVLLNAQTILTECVMVIFSLTTLLLYNARLLGIIAVVLLPPVCLLFFLTKRRLGQIKQNIKTMVARSLQYLREALAGFVESNIFDKNTFFINRHASTQAELGRKIASMQITQDLPPRLFEVFAILGLFILIVAIRFSGTMGSAYVILLGAFMAAAYKIIPGISRIINLHSQIRTYQHTISAVAVTTTATKTEPPVTATITAITFRDISFSYNGNKVLHRFNYHVGAGTLCGIGGDSGKGKTTLLNLVAGLLEPAEGAVLLNGVAQDRQHYRNGWQQMAYAKQDPFILHASILDNIVLFEERYDAGRLQYALKATGLDVLVDQSPEGVQKMVMEGGKNLSGGQRQRLALARALYKDAPVLLLDEPFSELDKDSEMALLQQLKALAATGKIILLISHNPESLGLCDTVIQLNVAPLPETIA